MEGLSFSDYSQRTSQTCDLQELRARHRHGRADRARLACNEEEIDPDLFLGAEARAGQNDQDVPITRRRWQRAALAVGSCGLLGVTKGWIRSHRPRALSSSSVALSTLSRVCSQVSPADAGARCGFNAAKC